MNFPQKYKRYPATIVPDPDEPTNRRIIMYKRYPATIVPDPDEPTNRRIIIYDEDN